MDTQRLGLCLPTVLKQHIPPHHPRSPTGLEIKLSLNCWISDLRMPMFGGSPSSGARPSHVFAHAFLQKRALACDRREVGALKCPSKHSRPKSRICTFYYMHLPLPSPRRQTSAMICRGEVLRSRGGRSSCVNTDASLPQYRRGGVPQT